MSLSAIRLQGIAPDLRCHGPYRQFVQELRRMLEQQPDRQVTRRLLADLLETPF